jgi:hypothetical protein
MTVFWGTRLGVTLVALPDLSLERPDFSLMALIAVVSNVRIRNLWIYLRYQIWATRSQSMGSTLFTLKHVAPKPL